MKTEYLQNEGAHPEDTGMDYYINGSTKKKFISAQRT